MTRARHIATECLQGAGMGLLAVFAAHGAVELLAKVLGKLAC